MKKIIFLLMIMTVSLSSCLKSDLEDVESSTNCELSNVEFEYRWTKDIVDSNGNPTGVSELQYKKLDVAKNIDKDNNKIILKLTVPKSSGNFTSEIRDKVSLENIVGMFTVSLASTVQPLGNAPKLGIPGDFSQKSYMYRIKSAAGNYTDWMIEIAEFNK